MSFDRHDQIFIINVGSSGHYWRLSRNSVSATYSVADGLEREIDSEQSKVSFPNVRPLLNRTARFKLQAIQMTAMEMQELAPSYSSLLYLSVIRHYNCLSKAMLFA